MINTLRFPFRPMKYPASNTTLSRGTACVDLPVVGEVIVFGKKKNAADGTSGGLLDLVENRAAGNEIRLPV